MAASSLAESCHSPCQRRKMTVCTTNGLRNGLVHNLLMQLLSPGSSKIEFLESCFYDIVITQNDHPRYIKHVLSCFCVLSTLFGI